MTQEDRNLLFRDLCARIPYGVKCVFGVDDATYEICGINPTCCGASEIQATHTKSGINGDFTLNSLKPYLFPLSSMTEEQKNEFNTKCLELQLKVLDDEIMYEKATEFEVDFYNKHHFDWRGLIEKGLAIDATNKGIY